MPPAQRPGDNIYVGNTRLVRAALWLVVFGACKEEDPFLPPGGSDAPPRIDAAIDAPFDAAPIDARIDSPLGDSPPVITLVSPAQGSVHRGVLRIEVMVTDSDGVMAVTGTASTQSFTLTQLMPNQPTFVGFLDTVPLSGTVSPTIVIRAEDTIGDSSTFGFQVVLDNFGPVASLDPPNVRATSPIPMTIGPPDYCSLDFDPLGADAPNDGEAVPQLFELRARITDRPNTGTLNTPLFVPKAGVATAQLYVFDDTTKPLVVDTNADGLCDAINPTIVPTTTPMTASEAAVSSLEVIPPRGAAAYGVDDFGGTNQMYCAVDPMPAPTTAICSGEPTSTVIIKERFTGTPEIYGMPVVSTFNCLGFAFDARATGISDGWACVAVLTTDGVGNVNVSAPLRVCIDSDGIGNECHPQGMENLAGAPNCTGTVTGGVVTTTACTPIKYFQGVADEYELVIP